MVVSQLRAENLRRTTFAKKICLKFYKGFIKNSLVHDVAVVLCAANRLLADASSSRAETKGGLYSKDR